MWGNPQVCVHSLASDGSLRPQTNPPVHVSSALGLLALQVAVPPQAADAANSKRPLSLNLLTMMRIQVVLI